MSNHRPRENTYMTKVQQPEYINSCNSIMKDKQCNKNWQKTCTDVLYNNIHKCVIVTQSFFMLLVTT